jgi:hypothetical protein
MYTCGAHSFKKSLAGVLGLGRRITNELRRFRNKVNIDCVSCSPCRVVSQPHPLVCLGGINVIRFQFLNLIEDPILVTSVVFTEYYQGNGMVFSLGLDGKIRYTLGELTWEGVGEVNFLITLIPVIGEGQFLTEIENNYGETVLLEGPGHEYGPFLSVLTNSGNSQTLSFWETWSSFGLDPWS